MILYIVSKYKQKLWGWAKVSNQACNAGTGRKEKGKEDTLFEGGF
jgi:hypothetical protein